MHRENIFIRILGLVLTLTALYFLGCKQILMPIIGVTKPAMVAGFKSKGNNTPTARNHNSRKLFDAKTAYARFVPTGAKDSITVLSDGNPMLGFLNFDQYDRVTVAYWSDANPQAATIISWRSYPIFLFCGFLGIILLVMGVKS